jgi:hypothetical protein
VPDGEDDHLAGRSINAVIEMVLRPQEEQALHIGTSPADMRPNIRLLRKERSGLSELALKQLGIRRSVFA